MAVAATVSIGCPVSSGSASTQASAACPADEHLARLVAASDHIWVGTLDLSRSDYFEQLASERPDYSEIPVTIESVLKGPERSEGVFRHYPVEAAYKPSDATIQASERQSAILFLVQVDEGPVGNYFAGFTPDALRMATEDKTAAVLAEVARQDQIVTGWQTNSSLPHYANVERLIGGLADANGREQQQIFSALEALGEPAVPAIIAQMNNRQPLNSRSISLANHSPDAFEAYRHYGPSLVVDALAAILNQITGENFGNIQNGGSDRQRDAAVAGWHIYAAGLGCTSTH